MSTENNNKIWPTVGIIALKLPVPSLVFILSYFLFQSDKDTPALLTLFVGLLYCTILLIDELYRGSIKNLKSDVNYYSKMAQQAHTQSFKNASSSTDAVIGMAKKYAKPDESTTSLE